MNILKLQDELKGVPDNALIGYVQSPTGQVPTYLALGELQRRKTMREKFQQQQAPQTTVAEDLAAPSAPPPMQQGIAAVAPQQMAAPQSAPMPQDPMAPPQGMAYGGEVHYADGGIAGLDTGNMFDEANYASGGIVAFADGGDTGMNLDELPSLNLDLAAKPSLKDGMLDGSSLSQNFTSRYSDIRRDTSPPREIIGYNLNVNTGKQEPQYAEEAQSMGSKYGYLPNGLKDPRVPFSKNPAEGPHNPLVGGNLPDYLTGRNSSPPQKIMGYSLNVNTGKQEAQYAQGGEVKRFAGLDGSYVNPGMYGGPVQEYEPWYKSLKLLGEKYNLYGDGLLGPNPEQDTIRAFENQRSMNPFISGMPRTDLADEYARLRLKASENKATQKDYDRMNEINQSMKSAENYPTGGGATKESIAAMQQADAAKAAKEKADADKAAKDKLYKDEASRIGAGGAKEKIRSLSDYAKEFRDVVGEDPMQARLMERMEKMDAAAAKQAEQAPWMALAQAGFGMAAGKSPYALQNIAVGAMEGVKSYGDARDKMASLEEKRFGLMADMAKAQRAEQLAIASKGADSRDAQLAREQQYKIHQEDQALKLKLSVIENTFDLQKTQIATAAKDLPNAVDRATKIDPLVMDDKDYKEGLKALEGKYGDKGVIPGSPNHDKYQADVDALYRKIYAKKVRNPLAASSFGAGALSYTPGKGFN